MTSHKLFGPADMHAPHLVPALSLALLASAPAQGTVASGDAAPVFVPDLCGRGEGAPPAKNLGKLVLLTDLAPSDAYYAVVKRLVAAKKPAAVIDFPAGHIESTLARLTAEQPEFALVVSRPDHLDVNLHFALLEMVAALDADPFADVAFGYVTGATAEEALAFVDRFLELQKKKQPLPRRLVEFGPIAQGPPQFGGPHSHELAKGWKRWFAFHGPVEGMLAKKDILAGAGILAAGGHGMPGGVVDGLSGRDLRQHALDLSPALYFSGPCYCGVTGGWFEPSAQGASRRVVEATESFALAAIASGVSALFAGFDPDRGETCSQEMEHLLVTGGALGHATKQTYDGVAVARRAPKLALFRYTHGKPAPHKDLVDTMTGGGACRALFGDPTWRPIERCAEPLFEIESRDTPKAFTLTWQCDRPDTSHWSSVDVYRCDGGWTHRIAFTVELPLATARNLKRFEVSELTAGGKPLEHRFPTAMLERWGGKARLHVYLVFPPRGQQNVFFVERDFVARFTFGK
jgi:hypothetical protein